MTEEIGDFEAEFAREQDLAVRVQMVEYAMVIEATVIAKMHNAPWLERLRELDGKRTELTKAHLAQSRRTTAAMKERNLDAIKAAMEELTDVN